MPVLSYVHELFNVDQCQAYIDTLRWKDRPLQCPRCQSHDVDPWGTYHYRPGCKRYWCNGRLCNPRGNTTALTPPLEQVCYDQLCTCRGALSQTRVFQSC